MLVAYAESAGLMAEGSFDHALQFARSESSMLPLPVGEKLEQLFGLYVSQTYAMTESEPIANNP